MSHFPVAPRAPFALLTFALIAAVAFAQPAPDFFEQKVRPVLARNCLACHAAAKQGGLEMTSRAAMLRGGNSGPALRPGDADGSLILQAVRHTHDRLKMPPGARLKQEEIEALESWVRDGAVWPEHAKAAVAVAGPRITAAQRSWWAFQPVRKPEPPPVKNKAWAKTPVDQFILAQLEARKLAPVEAADRRTWIRRASYDLTGLPPTPEETEAFAKDRSGDARAKVVDRLLASPAYGERWGRYWLDIARYADDRLNSTQDEAQPNVWRYRDWVIQAFNEDMPYNQFVKAQIAGDQMEPKERYMPGLGFFANSPNFQEDRVDALTRGFLGLTVACAQCHDHKFDPIPTRDYYSLLGVFESTKTHQFPLASPDVVARYEQRKKMADDQEKKVKDYEQEQARQLAGILAGHSARYLRAVRLQRKAGAAGEAGEAVKAIGSAVFDLDEETLARWEKYLALDSHEHPFLNGWREPSFDDDAFQSKLLQVVERKREIDRENMIRLGGKDDGNTVRVIEVLSLLPDDYFLWRDIVSGERHPKFDSGLLYYKEKQIDRFLAPFWKQHLESLRSALELRKKEIPEMYPFLMVVKDVDKPKNIRVYLKGDRQNPGEEAPRQFLSVLCKDEPKPFTKGSGRLELAEAIADKDNPMTARVMANRVWMYHFGRAIAGTPGNFGRLGEAPSHPELLDYLAARLMEQGWSIKALHREIMLSGVYGLGSRTREPNQTTDADNRFYWRANRRRLDVEPMRDTLLLLSGDLDRVAGGEAKPLSDDKNLRRTVYGFVSRRQLDGTLSLFDFPNPMSTSDGRIPTATPLQQLYFMNSRFMQARAASLAKRMLDAAPDERGRIRAAYRALFQREPLEQEIRLGLQYLASEKEAWPRYAQALLSANELVFVD
ncbi:MAG: PSD1 domain-containing protein [Acidobacteriia bacterium]|nr:PSD1 domain-containing protein [Terriglobia bacterium]